MDIQFNTSFGLRMSVENVVQEIVRFMKADEKRNYKIIIGSDSEKLGGNIADFVVAIVIHRVGNGGRYFWRRIEKNDVYSLHDRIIKEVLFSLEAARDILAQLRKVRAPHFDFEIHVDVGENGETKTMIQEVVGMIRANDFEVKTKPDSYAASKVADRHV